ncbi:P-loop containing nucleoside triphosphate hydrolase protein [Lophiotrema nucula]|uniref:P-loop containing nucleoside triphosphate hydrolase protein n=1 Tax=Lophiotrema nucula TaxID=690887 RepID=A0A6A5Z8B6_9PLEO|nr:P-loop containing nucleoside triphosphate hydrolase protein [Lophiotrema nucula]
MSTFALRPQDHGSSPYRIYMVKRELESLGLSNGDLISLSLSGVTKGFGIAWTVVQQNVAKNRIAKVSDQLRDRYGLSLKEQYSIEKANDEWTPIESINVSFVGSSSTRSSDLLEWTRVALGILDMILPGMEFDVQPIGLKARQNNTKSRAVVESIKAASEATKPAYFDLTRSQITTESASNEWALVSVDTELRIEAEGIGGLDDQIETINERLECLTSSDFKLSDPYLYGPTALLIHGPEGTGKSLLLDRLSLCNWKKVIRIDQDWLASNVKNQGKALSDTFSDAQASQPSIILMDDIDKFLGKAQNLVNRLRNEIRKLEGLQVGVAAAARSVYDVDASLRTTDTFDTEIELLAPNTKQREDTLRKVLGPSRTVSGVDFASLAERTHGYVGRDIHRLCGKARKRRVGSLWTPMRRGADTVASFRDVLEASAFVRREDFEAVIDEVQPTVLQESILEVPKVRWTDIAGVDHVREVLESITVRPYKYPELDALFGPESQKGVLLYGPPGCAKTLIAQAVATESNQNFLAVKGSELIKMYVGESERAIRDVFRRARAAKPCIIFFDEIDSIGKSREKSQDSGLNVVTTLLNEMDGIEALKEVFVIGATNRPDILDSALIRTGRFDSHIHIGLPNEDARRQIFQIHTRKRPIAGDVDLSVLASKTEGSSGADIKGLCTFARDLAIRDYIGSTLDDKVAEIRMCHFERALEDHVPRTKKAEAERYAHWRPGDSLSAV